MKTMTLTLILGLFASGAMAADTCQSKAVDKNNKKLAGAAMAAFLKKCQTDATTTCAKQAADKKLKGAAGSSFTKKCYSDAVGTS